MGWGLLTSDFGNLFLVGLVVEAILLGMYIVPCVSCLAPIAAVFLYPPLMAGLFLAVRAKVDGGPARVGALFLAFKHRYWDTVVAGLPVTLTALLAGVVFYIVSQAIGIGGMMWFQQSMMGGGGQPFPMAGAGPGPFGQAEWGPMLFIMASQVGLELLKHAVTGAVALFFMFALLAVWDFPGRGWDAARRSVALVRDHFLEALGLGLAFAGLYLAASVVGAMACCIGLFGTFAIWDAWFAATLIYVYRVWTGQPLVQEYRSAEEAAMAIWLGPAPAAGPPPGGQPPPGPIPPTDIQPPG
jgi:hypothetical protein